MCPFGPCPWERKWRRGVIGLSPHWGREGEMETLLLSPSPPPPSGENVFSVMPKSPKLPRWHMSLRDAARSHLFPSLHITASHERQIKGVLTWEQWDCKAQSSNLICQLKYPIKKNHTLLLVCRLRWTNIRLVGCCNSQSCGLNEALLNSL